MEFTRTLRHFTCHYRLCFFSDLEMLLRLTQNCAIRSLVLQRTTISPSQVKMYKQVVSEVLLSVHCIKQCNLYIQSAFSINVFFCSPMNQSFTMVLKEK